MVRRVQGDAAADDARPKVWDHSYYALVWHTLHWQQILYQLRLLPRAFSNSLDHVTSATGPAPVTAFLAGSKAPRLEFWWLRGRDLGGTAVFCSLFAMLPLAVVPRRCALAIVRRTGSVVGAGSDPGLIYMVQTAHGVS